MTLVLVTLNRHEAKWSIHIQTAFLLKIKIKVKLVFVTINWDEMWIVVKG
jgi:hypothetical protein